MDDIELVQIGYSADNLLKVAASLCLLDFGVFDDIVKKLSILYVFHHEEQVSRRLDDLIQLDDGRMPD